MYGIKRGIKMKGRFVSLLLSGGLLLVLGGVAWCSEEGAHGASHALNWSDFLFRALNFGLMVGILVWLLKKPASNFFASRRENIQKLLAELEDKKREAEGKSAEYTAKLAVLDAETASIVAELVQEGEAEKKKIIETALRQADYIKQQAQLAIQQELKAARESLQEEITELSVVAAEELIRKKLRPEDQERLVRDFMTRVVEAK
jgi:F-type H+-transporting ATPase subunit b